MNEGFIPIPNSIFDKYQKELKPSEFSVLLAIIRKTWGWNKTEDRISVSQISRASNVCDKTVVRCLKVLESKKIISTKKRHNQTTKIKILLGGDKISTPMDKFGGQRGTNLHTQQYNNNTYKPRHQDNVVLGGLMDLSQFEDS